MGQLAAVVPARQVSIAPKVSRSSPGRPSQESSFGSSKCDQFRWACVGTAQVAVRSAASIRPPGSPAAPADVRVGVVVVLVEGLVPQLVSPITRGRTIPPHLHRALADLLMVRLPPAICDLSHADPRRRRRPCRTRLYEASHRAGCGGPVRGPVTGLILADCGRVGPAVRAAGLTSLPMVPHAVGLRHQGHATSRRTDAALMPLEVCRLLSYGSGCEGAARRETGQGRRSVHRLRSLPVWLTGSTMGAVSAQEIDQYLDALEEPKRGTLVQLRQTILDLVPGADQGISYGVPAFKVRGKTIAGFAAFKNHLSYLPHSGSVFPQLKDELEEYSTSSGALRFGVDEPLPVSLVEKLIAVRLRQAFPA